MSKVVVISGHPNLEESHTNTEILNHLESQLSDVDVRRLDQLYPDFQIDVEAEQRALIEAQIIVLQFPFYWYSTPALLKKWIDDVFTYDFAYGANGTKLKGKDFFLSFTVGGPQESYDPLSYNHFTIAQFIRPLQQTAYLAGLKYREPIYTHRMIYIPGIYNTLEDVQGRAHEHALRLINNINELLDSEEEKIRRFVQDWFEEFDRMPADSDFFVQHLAPDVRWKMPEGVFNGHQGFCSWYEIAHATFKPGCDHQLEQMEIVKADETYEVQLRIRLLAETHIDSQFAGQEINMLVNETWQVGLDERGKISIHDYSVEPVASE